MVCGGIFHNYYDSYWYIQNMIFLVQFPSTIFQYNFLVQFPSIDFQYCIFVPIQLLSIFTLLSFLCTVQRNLCIVHKFLCTVHKKFQQFFLKMLNFHLLPRTKFLHMGSDSEIAFLKFHFLLELIDHNIHIIMFRRKCNFKKAISAYETLKCARILVLGSK